MDVFAGGVIGEIAAVITTWNLAILIGVEGGYEAGIGDVFGHSTLAGILVIAIWIAGPIVGVVLARRVRRNRAAHI